MVSIVDLEKSAMSLDNMPPDLYQFEQLAFLTLRTLYRDYKNGQIEQSQAKKEKLAILSAYQSNKQWHEIYQQTCEMRIKLLIELKKIGADEIIKILDGRAKDVG
jgi:hypothetical protein